MSEAVIGQISESGQNARVIVVEVPGFTPTGNPVLMRNCVLFLPINFAESIESVECPVE
jgi:hypothetical protein